MSQYNINTQWVQMLDHLINKGEKVEPRGIPTRELMGYQTTVDMSSPILTIADRKMNYDFMFGEAYYLLSGSNRVDLITQFMKVIGKFSDDGITFNGAYGPKIMEQMSYVVQTLFKDTESRQAVMSIWRERPASSKDIPCTLTLQFMIRDGKLNCFANMRSSDAWKGWVYDTFNFSMISHYICNWFNILDGHEAITPGHLVLTAASQHLYEQNLEKAVAIRTAVKNHNVGYVITPDLFENYEHPDYLLDDLFAAGKQYHDRVNHITKSEVSRLLREVPKPNETN